MRNPFIAFNIVLCLSSSLIHGDETFSNQPAEETVSSKLPTLRFLPTGSILTDVYIPRYTKQYTPESELNAKQIKILSPEKVQGSEVTLLLFNDVASCKLATYFHAFIYDQSSEILTSDQDLILYTPQLQTNSQGLIFDLAYNRGLFLGKNHSIIYLQDKESTRTTLPKEINLPKNSIANDQINTVERVETLQQAHAKTAQQIQQASASSALARQAQLELLHNIQDSSKDLFDYGETLVNNREPSPVPEEAFAAPAELKPEEGQEHFSINNDGGLFFDAEKGIIVFNKNVKVTHPNYKFRCAGEVKLFLAPKQNSTPATQKTNKKLKPNQRFGDISKIIATDDIMIRGKDKEGNPISAVAETLIYDHNSGVIILKGINSRITMPDKQLKVIKKDGHIKIDKNWNISGKGTQIDLNIEQLNN